MGKRTYRGTVQAEIATLTRQRIMRAALDLYESQWMDEITLPQVAARAGVTVQTILRHFHSKEGLLFAVAAQVRAATLDERAEVPAGEVAAAIAYLVEHYESVGDRMIRLLAQEDRYLSLKELLEGGRTAHRHWIGRVFAPFMPTAYDRERLVPQLTAICDVYVWKLFRRDMHMSVDQYRAALSSMITAVIDH